MAKRYHVSRHIDAPVERVWALLTDASRYRAWNRLSSASRDRSPRAPSGVRDRNPDAHEIAHGMRHDTPG
jgi:uncharacterized protein YndB with AHSA1/START domain